MNLTALRNRLIVFLLQKTRRKTRYDGDHARQVGAFYDRYNDQFLKVYGEVIQAFRTKNLNNLLDYQMGEIGLAAGQRILDAGCGVAGPATYFADKSGCTIDAVTISGVQAEAGRRTVQAAGLSDRVRVHHLDFHKIEGFFGRDCFDRVIFLESFGHSAEKEALLNAVWQVLKPGGEVYIKDLFVRKINYPLLQRRIDREIEKINMAYHYQVTELSEFVDLTRKTGFVISMLKTTDLGLDDFENLAISNEWQELTGIAQIKNWNNYVFPVDFFEVRLYKPEYDISKGKHRYFIQNLFQIRENRVDPADLGF